MSYTLDLIELDLVIPACGWGIMVYRIWMSQVKFLFLGPFGLLLIVYTFIKMLNRYGVLTYTEILAYSTYSAHKK